MVGRVWTMSVTTLNGREFELKVELTPAQLQQIDEHLLLKDLSVGQPVTRTLRSLYFDTPDHRLRDAGLSLRVRSDGTNWVQTIKSATNVGGNGVSHPVQLETSVGAPQPDLNAIEDPKLRRRVMRLASGSVLEPAFETVVKRTARHLHTKDGELELALDQGVVRAGMTEQPLCEAELELKAGAPESLLDVATKLFADGPLRLAESSKAERGYDLLVGRSGTAPSPMRADDVELAGNATCRDALAHFVGSATRQILANRPVVLETDDPEGAHQLRIGLRRLRSALRAFRPLIDTAATREMDHHAKVLAQSVGALRDADVFIDDIYASAAGAIKGYAGLQPLKEALRAHRLRKREHARAALQGNHWSALRLYLALWPNAIETRPALDCSASAFADDALHRAWKKVAKKGKHIATLSEEERHRMRKLLKKLRYTVEFFGSLYKKDDVRPFVKGLKQLQDVFGYVNDVKTARQVESIVEQHCRESRECHRAAGYVLGWHQANAVACWQRAQDGWDQLTKAERFWR
jgi:triphosphatase